MGFWLWVALGATIIGVAWLTVKPAMEALDYLFWALPSVIDNPVIVDRWEQSLLIADFLTILVITFVGFSFLTGHLWDIDEHQLKKIGMRLVIAYIFANYSLPLIQLEIDLNNSLALAFKPSELNIWQWFGISTTIVGAFLIESLALLGIVIMYLVRISYIYYLTVAMPILAILWVLPRVGEFSSYLMRTLHTAIFSHCASALAIGLAIDLLGGEGSSFGQATANWLVGISTFVLLLIIPFIMHAGISGIIGIAAYRLRRVPSGAQRFVSVGRTLTRMRVTKAPYSVSYKAPKSTGISLVESIKVPKVRVRYTVQGNSLRVVSPKWRWRKR